MRFLSVLENFPLRSEYQDEQRDLQPHIAEVLRTAIPKNLEVITGIGAGSPKPSIQSFGTSFWSDVEIRAEGKPLIGIEVKYVRAKQSASKAIEETLGQALIYTLRYPSVIAFILHDGIYNIKLVGEDEEMRRRLNEIGIQLVMRRRDVATAKAQNS